MDNIIPTARRNFEGWVPTCLFEAGIPIYFIRLQMEVLEPQELSSFEIYMLHAISLGINTREGIARLLGVDDRDLVSPGAALLKSEFIVQGMPELGGSRPIALTEKGRQALGDKKAPPVPVRKSAQLHFNALTWKAIPLEAKTWTAEQMEKEGLLVLPPQQYDPPTLGDFTVKDVAQTLYDVSSFQNKEITALLELKKVSQEYLAPVTVIALRDPASREQRVAVYRRGMLQQAESDVLQRLFETGKFHFPDDAVVLEGKQFTVPASLPPALVRIVTDLMEDEEVVRQIKMNLSDSRNRRGTTQDRAEREVLENQIRLLEAELRAKSDESERLQLLLKQSQGTFLRTEEHRAVLERALKEARDEIIIISPWMNRRTCDDALCDLVAEAVSRGVRIRIGYGITERPGDLDAGRNRAIAQRVIRALRESVAQKARGEQENLLTIQKTRGTHRKILVCDRTFGVLGSFNWLSYRGDPDKEYRNETSILLREPATIEELARIALSELE